MKKIEFTNETDIVLTDKYILWLEEFSKKHPVFSVKELLKNPKKLSAIDVMCLPEFGNFFKVIAEYAFYNFFDFSRIAKVKYNDFYFSIIKFSDEPNDYTFTVEEKTAENHDFEYRFGWFLDFKLIQKGECIKETEEIVKEFESIADSIREFQIKHDLGYDVLDGHLQYLFTSIYS